MNIGLIFHLDLVNDIFAVEQDGVNNGGCHRCKRQAVTDSKCGGKEQWRVSFVSFLVETQILGDDSQHIV